MRFFLFGSLVRRVGPVDADEDGCTERPTKRSEEKRRE